MTFDPDDDFAVEPTDDFADPEFTEDQDRHDAQNALAEAGLYDDLPWYEAHGNGTWAWTADAPGDQRPNPGDTVRRKDQPEITATVTGLKMYCVIVRLPSGKKRYWDDGTYDLV